MKVIFIKARVLFNMKNTALSRVGFGATMLSGSVSVVAPIKSFYLMTSTPMYLRRASGTVTEPSLFW